MRDHAEEFRANGIAVAVVGQGDSADLTAFMERREVPFTPLADPTHAAFRAYGLARGTAFQIALSPRVIAAGAAAAREGHLVSRPVGDPRQLPGSFVVVAGRIVYAHRGATSADIAPPRDLVAAAVAASAGG